MLILHEKSTVSSYHIDKNNSDVISWENTKAPGSALDSNSSASERLSLNGLQLDKNRKKYLFAFFPKLSGLSTLNIFVTEKKLGNSF